MFTAGPFRTSNATTEISPFCSSLTLHTRAHTHTHTHTHSPSAALLHGHVATVAYLFISYSSHHSIHFPLTNQAALLWKTSACFNKMWIPYTQSHSHSRCCLSQNRKAFVLPRLEYLYLDIFTSRPMRKTKILGDKGRASNSIWNGEGISFYAALIRQSTLSDKCEYHTCECEHACGYSESCVQLLRHVR